jgi:general secretion pathway protein J
MRSDAQIQDFTGPTGARPSAGPRAAGFTLIEILIVLVIVAFISGILVTSFERVLDVRLRIASFLDTTETPTLVASWFRDSIGGLVADVKDGADQFGGAERQMTGLTVAPLSGPPGVPTRITWEIAYDSGENRTYLRYQSANAEEMAVASWPGDRGDFQYCGPDFVCHSAWPPPSGTASELPSFILLDAVKGTENWPVLAAPRSDRDPLRRPNDLPKSLGGRS